MGVRLKLNEIPLFRFVPEHEAETLSKCTLLHTKKKDDIILIAGEDTPGIYLVVTGRVGVFKKGNPKPIAVIGPNEAIGEMSLVENTNASATIRAMEKTQLAFIHKERFLEQLEGRPELASAFYKGVSITLSRRLRQTTTKISKEMSAESFQNEEWEAHDFNSVVVAMDATMKTLTTIKDSLKQLKGWAMPMLQAMSSSVGEQDALKLVRLEEHIEEVSIENLTRLETVRTQLEKAEMATKKAEEIVRKSAVF